MSSPVYHHVNHLLKSSLNLKYWRTCLRKLCTQMALIDESKLSADLIRRKPQEPKPEDCCGDGCKLCVYDLYDQEMKLWKDECYVFLGYSLPKTEESSEIDSMSPLCYTTCTLKKIKSLSRNCNLYYFKLPERTNLDMKPGEHLVLRGLVQGSTITRPYTPVKNQVASFSVLIKLYEHGLMSQFVSTWVEGCQLDWRGPLGAFSYKKNQHKKLVLLAAGTGIAPMIHVIQSILDEETDETRIQLCFCCRTYDEVLMKDLLDEWRQYWNFQVTYYLSQEKDVSRVQYGESVNLGRLDIAQLKNHLTDENQTRVLVCGTNIFNSEMKNNLASLNFPNENIHIF